MAGLKDIETWAAESNRKLTCFDFKGDRYVAVTTDEGYRAVIPSAFAVRYKDWYVVFAEHHSPKCFHKDDVTDIYEYQITKRQSQLPTYLAGLRARKKPGPPVAKEKA